ncbi:hypothetical protein LCGC14_0852150 [marine sediment metagenome]|uniref:Uncharacterized protein n=1 Tax=marine sediment metagenome TaxID=412755 RepID=A0A0F9PV69_9ZZZZ
MERIIALANAGDIAGAEARYAQFAHPTLLSGHDRQKCEHAIAQARERATSKKRAKRRK